MMSKKDFILNIRKVFAAYKGVKDEHTTLEVMAKYLEKVLPEPLVPEKKEEVVRAAEEE